MQEIRDFIAVSNNIKAAHWLTNSYAEHKALGKFYEGLNDLLDSFVETYQGKYGRVDVSGVIAISNGNGETVANTVYTIAESAEKNLQSSDTDLLNILAEIKGLANHTKYLLTLK